MGNIVAIVGRPNVGKSTLFNRLTESRDAIVESESGVTRDRHYGKGNWVGHDFSVIDTGGYVQGSDDIFEEEINKQVLLAIEEANAIVFVVDVVVGITDLDEAFAKVLRRTSKPVMIAVNKVDTSNLQLQAAEFYGLGFEHLFNISSANGSGTGELLDHLIEVMPKDAEFINTDDVPRLTVVGRPNAGKSSIINAFLNQDRNIVTDKSGTTRDTVETRYTAYGFDFFLVDTAGLRKKKSIDDDIEFYSTVRTYRAIENSDVCLMMIDATRGVEKQDLVILNAIIKNQKGVVILINKWDLIEKDTHTADKFKQEIKERIAPFTDVPILFTSATEKQRIHKALEMAVEVYQNKMQKIPTSKLNDVMLPYIAKFLPPIYKGKEIHIKYVTQLPTHNICFAFYCNLPQYVKDPYKRYLENKLRENFELTGVPFKIFFRKK